MYGKVKSFQKDIISKGMCIAWSHYYYWQSYITWVKVSQSFPSGLSLPPCAVILWGRIHIVSSVRMRWGTSQWKGGQSQCRRMGQNGKAWSRDISATWSGIAKGHLRLDKSTWQSGSNRLESLVWGLGTVCETLDKGETLTGHRAEFAHGLWRMSKTYDPAGGFGKGWRQPEMPRKHTMPHWNLNSPENKRNKQTNKNQVRQDSRSVDSKSHA